MQLEDHFAARCRAVVTIPYDPHLEAGGVLDIDELDEETAGRLPGAGRRRRRRLRHPRLTRCVRRLETCQPTAPSTEPAVGRDAAR